MKLKFQIMAVCMITLIIIACSEMNDLHEPFIKDGEQIYIGKAENVLAYPGKNRLKLTWNINADPKITTARVQWRDTEDRVVEFPIAPVNGLVEQLIEGVPEGGFNFDIFLLGDNGERSVKVQAPAVVFGEKYESRLFARTISTNVAVTGGHADITWGPLTTGMRWTIVKYTDKNNQEKTIYVPPTDNLKIRISDHLLGKKNFSYATSFKPLLSTTYLSKPFVVSAIDTLNANFVVGVFPN